MDIFNVYKLDIFKTFGSFYHQFKEPSYWTLIDCCMD